MGETPTNSSVNSGLDEIMKAFGSCSLSRAINDFFNFFTSYPLLLMMKQQSKKFSIKLKPWLIDSMKQVRI